MICGKSWGTVAKGWDWCSKDRGHSGCCENPYSGVKPNSVLFFDQQPEVKEMIDKQRERQAIVDAKKK